MQHIDNLKKLFNRDFVESPLIESFDAGFLHLASGRIVACDPLITNDKLPFKTQFPKGDFPIYIHKERESNCIAYVELVFSKKPIDYWQLATCLDQHIEDLREGEIFGYPVESGMGCLMDTETQESLNELEQKLFRRKGDDFMGIYEEFFHEYFFDENGAIDQYAVLKPNGEQKHNIVAFEAGYGEGFYASYIGFDKSRAPVKLITEFIEVEG